MFGIGANELLIILLFGFLIFGPDKLPAMAKTVGRAIAKFRSAQQEMNNVIKNEVYDPNSDDPFKNPLDALSKVEERVTREDRGESFSERKARYDKQRAAQKAAQERKEAAAKAKEEAQADAADAETTGAAKAAVAAAASKAADVATDAADAKAADKEAKPSIDELYGVSKKARKPKAAETPEAKAEADKPAKAAKTSAAVGDPVDKQLDEALDDSADETAKGGE